MRNSKLLSWHFFSEIESTFSTTPTALPAAIFGQTVLILFLYQIQGRLVVLNVSKSYGGTVVVWYGTNNVQQCGRLYFL